MELEKEGTFYRVAYSEITSLSPILSEVLITSNLEEAKKHYNKIISELKKDFVGLEYTDEEDLIYIENLISGDYIEEMNIRDIFEELEDEKDNKMVLKDITLVNTPEEATQIAIDYQLKISNKSMYMSEVVEYSNYFEELGKKFNLTEEFKENCII